MTKKEQRFVSTLEISHIHTMNTNKEKNMSFINNSWVRILLSMNVCNCSFSAVKPIHCFKKPSHSFPESEFS